MVAWFLGLEDVLSWLLVEGKCDAITFDINSIALFRQAIGSSPRRNDGTTSPESSWGNSTCGCCKIGPQPMKGDLYIFHASFMLHLHFLHVNSDMPTTDQKQTDGEAMINSIKNGDQPLPRVTQVSIAGTFLTKQPPLKDKSMWSDQKKRIQKIDQWKQYATMTRQNKILKDINIDALYNILKQNQGDVNDAMGSKKKTVVVTSDPLTLIAEKTNMSRSKEKVVVSSDSKGSEVDDFSKLKKITALLAKAFNRRKFYSKPTNNNLRTSSSS
nr:hypothetical protein [Tanacetum cinerariifolium]